jgi:hypothetical protein
MNAQDVSLPCGHWTAAKTAARQEKILQICQAALSKGSKMHEGCCAVQWPAVEVPTADVQHIHVA